MESDISRSSIKLFLLGVIHHQGVEHFADGIRHFFGTNQGKATNPTVFAPTYQGEFIAGLDPRPGAGFLGQHHLAAFIDGDDRLDLVGNPAFRFCAATFFAFGFGHVLAKVRLSVISEQSEYTESRYFVKGVCVFAPRRGVLCAIPLLADPGAFLSKKDGFPAKSSKLAKNPRKIWYIFHSGIA
jgi:hypothetical protein